MLLLVVTVTALLWANSPASDAYFDLWHQGAGFELGPVALHMSLHHWINDGLTVVFFFLIGLEVRQEFAHGSLRDRTRTRIAVIAGVAGVCLPAVIYAVIVGSGDSLQGWGVVVGTDTAFMLGALALLGPHDQANCECFSLPSRWSTTLAVSNIGFVYSENIRLIPLLVSLACLTALWLLGRARQWRAAPYILVVIVLWFSTIESGVHPSLAGMVAGLLIPAYPTQRHKVEAAPELFRDFWQSPSAASGRAVSRGLAKGTAVNERIHEYLRVPTALIVVPIFALANAGVDLRGGLLVEAFSARVTWGVVLGLVLGKLLGIGAATYIAVRLGAGRLPQGVGMGSVMGGSALSGMGFTVSLLIIGLAFGTSPELAGQATVGVLVAMVLAAVLGAVIFRVAATKLGEAEADLPHRAGTSRRSRDRPHSWTRRRPADPCRVRRLRMWILRTCHRRMGRPARPLRRRSALRGPVTYRWWTSIRTHWLPHMQQRPPHGSTCSGNGWTSCSPARTRSREPISSAMPPR